MNAGRESLLSSNNFLLTSRSITDFRNDRKVLFPMAAYTDLLIIASFISWKITGKKGQVNAIPM
jgi:hypothetical protein